MASVVTKVAVTLSVAPTQVTQQVTSQWVGTGGEVGRSSVTTGELVSCQTVPPCLQAPANSAKVEEADTKCTIDCLYVTEIFAKRAGELDVTPYCGPEMLSAVDRNVKDGSSSGVAGHSSLYEGQVFSGTQT